MSKYQTKDLLKFLKPFSDEKKDTVFWLREFVWDLYPKANELIYDNYNALAFGWSPTDKFGIPFVPSPLAGRVRTSTLVFIGDRC